jgi:hypothetical protein
LAISALDSPEPTSFSTSRSRSVRVLVSCRASAARSMPLPSWVITRWAMRGDRQAAPSATACTPAISSRGSPALSMNPLAPFESARATYSPSLNVVRMMTLVSGVVPRISVSASSPSSSGIWTSSSATSGRCFMVSSTAPRPFTASATTSMSSSLLRIAAMPARIMPSSSASSTRITGTSPSPRTCHRLRARVPPTLSTRCAPTPSGRRAGSRPAGPARAWRRS